MTAASPQIEMFVQPQTQIKSKATYNVFGSFSDILHLLNIFSDLHIYTAIPSTSKSTTVFHCMYALYTAYNVATPQL